jgi:hypothetical protein
MPTHAPTNARAGVSRFMPTSRRLVQFSEGKTAPAGGRVVYIDGAFDMFHPGHVEILKARRAGRAARRCGGGCVRAFACLCACMRHQRVCVCLCACLCVFVALCSVFGGPARRGTDGRKSTGACPCSACPALPGAARRRRSHRASAGAGLGRSPLARSRLAGCAAMGAAGVVICCRRGPGAHGAHPAAGGSPSTTHTHAHTQTHTRTHARTKAPAPLSPSPPTSAPTPPPTPPKGGQGAGRLPARGAAL